MMFALQSTANRSRTGLLATEHGTIETPFFLPVATGGAMRGILLPDLETLGAQALLCNTYHLHLRPGEHVVTRAGGLHRFIGWDRPILTDSGGFQIFSMRHRLRITDDGVHFRSHLDGSALFLGPKEAMDIQQALGADIIMCFDECPPSTAPRSTIASAVDRTLRWATECKRLHNGRSLLFGIVQGGLERDLREKCVQELIGIGFDGYALGGLAVGESETEMFSVLDAVCPLLPPDKPRYLMGVGRMTQVEKAVAMGIDMFDCVLPMREARHGTIYLRDGATMRIGNSQYRNDHTSIDSDSPSLLSRRNSRSYLHHLFRTRERAAETIACLQNMAVVLAFMRDLRRTAEPSEQERVCATIPLPEPRHAR